MQVCEGILPPPDKPSFKIFTTNWSNALLFMQT